MMPIAPDQPFALVSVVNQSCAIQAGPSVGSVVTLQSFDPSFSTPAQLFVLRVQDNIDNNDNLVATGVALVSLGALDDGLMLSVASGGESEPLVMVQYTTASTSPDAWTLVQTTGNGFIGLRIIYPQNQETIWSWNDWGGNGNPGDQIRLNDDQLNNSVWYVVFASAEQLSNFNARLAAARSLKK